MDSNAMRLDWSEIEEIKSELDTEEIEKEGEDQWNDLN
jgi:hypothetical protein